jgi:hypothetical protein
MALHVGGGAPGVRWSLCFRFPFGFVAECSLGVFAFWGLPYPCIPYLFSRLVS